MTHYTVGTWHGLPNYCCAYCPYATIKEGIILQHLNLKHASAITPAAPKREPPPLTFDAVGKVAKPKTEEKEPNGGIDDGKSGDSPKRTKRRLSGAAGGGE